MRVSGILCTSTMFVLLPRCERMTRRRVPLHVLRRTGESSIAKRKQKPSRILRCWPHDRYARSYLSLFIRFVLCAVRMCIWANAIRWVSLVWTRACANVRLPVRQVMIARVHIPICKRSFCCLFLFSMQMPLQNLCSDVHFLRFRRDSQSTDSDLFLSSIPRFLCVFYDEE